MLTGALYLSFALRTGSALLAARTAKWGQKAFNFVALNNTDKIITTGRQSDEK